MWARGCPYAPSTRCATKDTREEKIRRRRNQRETAKREKPRREKNKCLPLERRRRQKRERGDKMMRLSTASLYSCYAASHLSLLRIPHLYPVPLNLSVLLALHTYVRISPCKFTQANIQRHLYIAVPQLSECKQAERLSRFVYHRDIPCQACLPYRSYVPFSFSFFILEKPELFFSFFPSTKLRTFLNRLEAGVLQSLGEFLCRS